MKINFDQEIKRDDGSSIVKERKAFKAVKNDAGDWVSEADVTYQDKTMLSDVCAYVLMGGIVKVTVAETMRRFHLHNKIVKGGEVELTDEELEDLKNLINNKYDLMMAGKVLVMLGEK